MVLVWGCQPEVERQRRAVLKGASPGLNQDQRRRVAITTASKEETGSPSDDCMGQRSRKRPRHLHRRLASVARNISDDERESSDGVFIGACVPTTACLTTGYWTWEILQHDTMQRMVYFLQALRRKRFNTYGRRWNL